MTDVQTLIAALTTERDSLTKAIAALQQISPRQAAAPKLVARRKGRTQIHPDLKQQIVARMAAAPRGMGSAVARECAEEFGIKEKTVNSCWRIWSSDLQAPVSSSSLHSHLTASDPAFVAVQA